MKNYFPKIILMMTCVLAGINQVPAKNLVLLQGQKDSVRQQSQIEVEYIQTDSGGVRWKEELELARIIPSADKKGIRITLPNSDPAKVIILDKKGKKKLKALKYTAPAIIDISDLKKGTYQLILESHQIVVVKSFNK